VPHVRAGSYQCFVLCVLGLRESVYLYLPLWLHTFRQQNATTLLNNMRGPFRDTIFENQFGASSAPASVDALTCLLATTA